MANAELEAIESLVARMRQEYQMQGSSSSSHSADAVSESGSVVSGHQAQAGGQEAMAVAGAP